MVRTESDLQRMTKQELKQWLTKHDQRLPAVDKLKPYYFDRATEYFRVLQKEQSAMEASSRSRERTKHGIKPTRTKKKLKSQAAPGESQSSSQQMSKTPTSVRSKVVRTQRRRHSSAADSSDHEISASNAYVPRSPSPSPSLTRSKCKVHKVVRKTPTKQSPSLSRSIKKKRDRVRRQTVDPVKMRELEQQENDQKIGNQMTDDDDEYDRPHHGNHHDDDDDEHDFDIRDIAAAAASQRTDNLLKRCRQDPEHMTIPNLQGWLDGNSIDFQRGQKKAAYVALVRKHSMPLAGHFDVDTKKHDLSPNHKQQYASPQDHKKLKQNPAAFVSPVRQAAPLPRNIRMSPLTPQDDQKQHARSRLSQDRSKQQQDRKTGLLLTPALNKTGISKIDTPSKLAMRDEIRSLLNLEEDDPMLPAKASEDGVTPGGGYDVAELENVLTDLRRAHKPQTLSPANNGVKVFTSCSLSAQKRAAAASAESDFKMASNEAQDHPQQVVPVVSSSRTGFFSALMNKISPRKLTSPVSMPKSANAAALISTATKHKLNRTLPSPISSPVGSVGDESPVVMPTFRAQKQKNRRKSASAAFDVVDDDDDDDVPQTPALTNVSQFGSRSSERLGNNHNNGNVLNPRRSTRIKQKYGGQVPPKPAVSNSASGGGGSNISLVSSIAQRHTSNQRPLAATTAAVSEFSQNNNIRSRRPPYSAPGAASAGFCMQQPLDSPGVGVAPSIPPKFNPMNSVPFDSNLSSASASLAHSAASASAASRSRTTALQWFLMAALAAATAWSFVAFDAASTLSTALDRVQESVSDWMAEEQTFFCDSESNVIAAFDSDRAYACVPCPKHALRCQNGRAQCDTNYILRDQKCILDGITVKFAFEIKNQAFKLLAQRRGRFECDEMDTINDDGYGMTEDELFSHVEIVDQAKKFEAFAYFKKNVVPDSGLIGVDRERGHYFAYKSLKSPMCRAREWAWSNLLFLMATSCICMLFVSWYCQCKRRQQEKRAVQTMVSEIYKILEEYYRCDDKQHVPVDIIKQQMKPKSNALWKRAENVIYKDARINKSVRMIDGIQRNCWKLLSMPLINHNQNHPLSSSHRNIRSSVPQQQQVQQPPPPPPDFNYLQANQPRFPPHSKPARW